MAKYSIAVFVILPFLALGSFKTGDAQLAANLSAPAGATNLSATGLSANLSASNGPSMSAGSSSGGRAMSGATGIVSSPSPPASQRSRRGLFEKQDAALQGYSSPSVSKSNSRWTSSQVKVTRQSAVASFGLHNSYHPAASATASFSRASTSKTPVYSFLMRHEKPKSPFGSSRQGLPGKAGRGNKSESSLVESLLGAGGPGASHR
jgi:hypothetical protein